MSASMSALPIPVVPPVIATTLSCSDSAMERQKYGQKELVTMKPENIGSPQDDYLNDIDPEPEKENNFPFYLVALLYSSLILRFFFRYTIHMPLESILSSAFTFVIVLFRTALPLIALALYLLRK